MPTIRLNDTVIHYDLVGDPAQKPLIVLANSLGTDFRIWNDMRAELADAHSFLLYDKRGHGLSDLATAPYQISDLSADLAALMDHLDVGPAVICGLSVGGLIAQGLYRARPELVRAMILMDTGHKIGTQDMWNDRIGVIEQGGIAALSEPILERWFSAEYRANAADFAIYRNMLERTPDAGYLATARAIRDADFTEACADVACPVACIVGTEDGATPPALMQETARLIPHASYTEVSGAGHLPCIEFPALTAGIVRGFAKALT